MSFLLWYPAEDENSKEDLFIQPCQAQKILLVEEKVFINVFGVTEHFTLFGL